MAAVAVLSSSFSFLRSCRRPFRVIKAATFPPFSSLSRPTSFHGFISISPLTSFNCRYRSEFFHVRATSNEEDVAKAAAVNAEDESPTIFDKIVNKEIPSTIVYEDDKVLAFRDISPQAPVHVLVIPKFRDGLTQLGKAEERHSEVLGRLLYAAKIVAEKEGILDGFRVVINNGPSACQSVYHLHLHVLGGRQMKWPPG